MAKILLDYFMPISAIEPTASASTAFLKQACLVVSPKDGGVTPNVVTACTTMSQVNALAGTAAAAEAQELFNGGLSKVYILPVNDLDMATVLASSGSQFYTLIISSDFDKDDVNASQATGTITISNYSNLLTSTPDTVTVGTEVFTAQSGAVVAGENTFRAATDNDTTAASLAAQINAHEDLEGIVTAEAVGAVVTITSVDTGSSQNSIVLGYSDLGGGNIGATKSGTTLTGGDGLFLGTWDGVVAVQSTDDAFLATQAAISKRCAFHSTSGNKAKNMCYAFGKMLSNSLNWRNQQYIEMPFADDVDTKGECDTLFDDGISFVLTDDEFGNRLGLFACGGQAIIAPYVIRNLQVDMQSAGLSYISGNQPEKTYKQAALIEDTLQAEINDYIEREWISAGTVEVSLGSTDFVVEADINVSEPSAMWRIFSEMRQTL